MDNHDETYRLIGLGRIPAATRDLMGDTLGSFSGLALEPGSWAAKSDGVSGVFLALPDRGFNVPEKGKFSDYASRVHRIAFALKDGTLSLSLAGTRYLRDGNGALTTGIDPQDHWIKHLGARLPSPKTAAGAGRISIDSEGLAVADDGRLFVSDEFACTVYCFSPDGQMTGVISPPDAFVPHVDGKVCFSSQDGIEVERGRMPNDGFEGLSLSPDGQRLYALLQSPLRQDRDGPQTSWRYTRLLVFDVAGQELPTTPIAHYVVELPLYGDELRPAEANDIVVLDEARILVLARDNRGFAAKKRNLTKAIAFKSVMSGSLARATNLAGSIFENKAKPVAPDGKLEPDIVPVKLTPFLDITDEAELNRVGLSARAAKRGHQLLSAKWESLVLSPVLNAKRPRERLLFVGNDNDFRTRAGFMPDGAYDGGFEHDSMVLAYRVMLPD